MQCDADRKANIPWERGHLSLGEGWKPSFPGLFHASEGVRALVPGRMHSRQHAGCVYICPMTIATARR